MAQAGSIQQFSGFTNILLANLTCLAEMVASITGTQSASATLQQPQGKVPVQDEVQDLATEISKESTVVDMDGAAAQMHAGSDAGKAKHSTCDIDELASDLALRCKANIARTKSMKELEERLELEEQELMKDFQDESTTASRFSCTWSAATAADEIFVTDDVIRQWA